jgi:NADH dehydrogenase (ubiquinone) 1 beta subcomplex subunit 8
MTTIALRRIPGRLSPQSATQIRRYATTPPKQEPDPQLNGYPQLPWVSRQNLPARGWQDPLMRRYFGDTVRHIFCLYPSAHCRPRASVT